LLRYLPRVASEVGAFVEVARALALRGRGDLVRNQTSGFEDPRDEGSALLCTVSAHLGDATLGRKDAGHDHDTLLFFGEGL
jgi:hypothetical protein